MRLALAFAVFLSLCSFTPIGSAQKATCSCEKTADNTCRGTVTCPDGCTSLCGSNDMCYLSCRSDLLYERINQKFVNKRGEEIAALLSTQTHKRIQFVPYSRNTRSRYSLEIKDDDIWNALNFLDRHGNVKVNGVDFDTLRKLRREMRAGRKVSVTFIGIPAKSAVDRLSFITGLRLHVKSGDDEKLVSMSLQQVTLTEIIDRISATTGVKVETLKRVPVR
jgi:hypothetical protein